MTLIATPIFVRHSDEVDQAIDRARQAASQGANLIEWRVDALGTDERAVTALERLVKASPRPCVLTCRSQREGGLYDGGGRERGNLLGIVARSENPPRYLDLEFAIYAEDADVWPTTLNLHTDDTPPSLILSVHDFDRRPVNLIQQIEAMVREAHCRVVKVVWYARSLRDNLEAFTLLSERRKPMIALCMGPFGMMSRALAPKFGGFITFAALDRGEESAPGQPTIEELRGLYRFDSINAQTNVYGIIGWPVEHSLSPHLHNSGFEEIEFNGVYLPMPIPPEYEHFKATVGAFIDHAGLHFRGASVTIPHKENLLRFVQETGGRVDPAAELAGAANTLLVGTAGAIVCRNTDTAAIVDALSDALNVDPEGLRGRRIAVLGAGGAARAAVAGLIQHDAHVTIFNRTQERAEALASEMSRKSNAIESKSTITLGDASEMRAGKFKTIINCTSIGMEGGPGPDQSPLEVLAQGEVPLDESVTVFDTVYAPWRTPLVAEAQSRGARVVLGIDMLIRQAALQFESWTGERAPVDLWFEVLEDVNETTPA